MTGDASAELHRDDCDQVDAAEPQLVLYHLIRHDSVDYGEAQELVVAASNPIYARSVAADASKPNEAAAWLDPRRSTVSDLVAGTEPRVVVFNVLEG